MKLSLAPHLAGGGPSRSKQTLPSVAGPFDCSPPKIRRSAILAAAVSRAPPASLFFQPLVVHGSEPLSPTNCCLHLTADIAEVLALFPRRRYILFRQRTVALNALHGRHRRLLTQTRKEKGAVGRRFDRVSNVESPTAPNARSAVALNNTPVSIVHSGNIKNPPRSA